MRRTGALCSIVAWPGRTSACTSVHESARVRARAGASLGPQAAPHGRVLRCSRRAARHIGDPGYFFPRKSNHSQHEYLHELSMYSGFVAHCPSAAHW